jgi:3-oxoacyl-[acyl-carrier-protein] synthase-3
MGTIIEATATAEGGSLGALGLADAAARLCLERAKRTAEEVDLLINAGVYNDKGISEPAVASLIQEDIGANPEQQPGTGQGTFSFDVRNGGCGVLSGIELVDGMLASGTVKLGLVVASDIDPEPGVSEGFGFPAVGGAVLLSADDSRGGFTAFRCATFPRFSGLFQSSVAWQDDTRPGRSDQGRNVLTVEIGQSYADRALECAESTVREMAAESVLDLGEVDVSSRRRRFRGSPPPWPSGWACPPRGSQCRRKPSPARTPPHWRWRCSRCHWRRDVPRCSSAWAQGSPSWPRSTGDDQSCAAARRRSHPRRRVATQSTPRC